MELDVSKGFIMEFKQRNVILFYTIVKIIMPSSKVSLDVYENVCIPLKLLPFENRHRLKQASNLLRLARERAT